MSGPKVWLSEVTCLKETVWLECEGNIKDPGQSSRYTPFPTKRAVKLRAWILTGSLSTVDPLPPLMSLFGLLEALVLKETYSKELESNPLGPSHGCYSEPNLHQIPLQGVEGRSAGRSSPPEDPEFLRCSTELCQPCLCCHHGHIPCSTSTPCMYFHCVNNFLCPLNNCLYSQLGWAI